MKKGDMLFVYGTLRRGERADISKNQGSFGVSFVSQDRINGKMYHIGAYPGVKTKSIIFDPSLPLVTGEVFLIRHPSITAMMDAYEGYDSGDPTRGLYDRMVVKTEKDRNVWVYTYNPPVIADQLIDSGDWVKNPTMTQGSRLRA